MSKRMPANSRQLCWRFGLSVSRQIFRTPWRKLRRLLREIQLSGMVRLYVKEDASKQQATLLAFRTERIPTDIQNAMAEIAPVTSRDPAFGHGETICQRGCQQTAGNSVGVSD